MQLAIVIILCILLILSLWVIRYRPQSNETKEGFNFKKIKNSIVRQVNNLKKSKGASILKLLPPALAAKLVRVVPGLKKQEQKKREKDRKEKERKKQEKKEKEKKERERKERERIIREKKEAEEKEKKRVKAVTKTIEKLMELAPKYSESKYDIKTIINGEEMDNFIHGRNVISALQTYVNGPFTGSSQVVLLVKILRESMGLTTLTYT
jgi:outer membrane biosynthesis protein TonB